MKQMDSVGESSFVAGILMIIFHRPMGVWLCNFDFGREGIREKLNKNNKYHMLLKNYMDWSKKRHEKDDGPLNLLVVGLILIVQGIILMFLGK